MKTLEEIDIFETLEYIKRTAPKYAKAKAERIYLEEFRRSLKAKLMSQHVGEAVNAQERDALCHNDYIALLDGLKEAVDQEETLKWRLIAAQAMIGCWQTLSANERAEKKII